MITRETISQIAKEIYSNEEYRTFIFIKERVERFAWMHLKKLRLKDLDKIKEKYVFPRGVSLTAKIKTIQQGEIILGGVTLTIFKDDDRYIRIGGLVRDSWSGYWELNSIKCYSMGDFNDIIDTVPSDWDILS